MDSNTNPNLTYCIEQIIILNISAKSVLIWKLFLSKMCVSPLMLFDNSHLIMISSLFIAFLIEDSVPHFFGFFHGRSMVQK